MFTILPPSWNPGKCLKMTKNIIFKAHFLAKMHHFVGRL
nr:MAG TPA: hypothetical protein [Caudoviricetes sp.]